MSKPKDPTSLKHRITLEKAAKLKNRPSKRNLRKLELAKRQAQKKVGIYEQAMLDDPGNRDWYAERVASAENSTDQIEGWQSDMRVSVEARHRGKAGAAARWEGRETLNAIIETLAKTRDELGEYAWPIELWPQLYSALESAGLQPVEEDNPKRYTCCPRGADSPQSISYRAFRKQIERPRKPKRRARE